MSTSTTSDNKAQRFSSVDTLASPITSEKDEKSKPLEREETYTGSAPRTIAKSENQKGDIEAFQAISDEDWQVTSKFVITFIGLALTTFLTGLDQTIIAPAIPVISNDFDTISDVGWWVSAYFMTSTSLQPLFGRLYSFFSLKWVYVATLAIFELGSIICAVSKSSEVFIFGRAVAGVGVAGGYIGGLTILAASVPVSKQALYTALMGASFGAGGIAGPLLGGVFTTSVTWRWCFYINLPIGIPTIAAIVFLFEPPKRKNSLTLREKLMRIDWVGSALILACITSLLLALQWGGVQDDWSDSKIIGLLVGFGVIGIAFVAVQVYVGQYATLPIRLLLTRTVGFASLANFCIGASYFTLAYFIPIYFQTIKGSSAIHSGIQSLPLIVSTIVAVMFAGGLVPAIGYSNPFLILGAVLAVVGSGLVYTFEVNTGSAHWIGYQIIAGLGVGMAFMCPVNIVQAAYTGTTEVEVVTAITIFFQSLGGCFFVSISQSIYQNEFLRNLINSIPPSEVGPIIAGGLSAFREFVSPELLPVVVKAAMNALTKAFIPPIALAACLTIVSVGLPWNSVKGAPMPVAAA